MALVYVGGTFGTGTSSGYTVNLSGTLTGGIASSPSEGDLLVVVSSFIHNSSFAPNVSGNISGLYTPIHAAIDVVDTHRTQYQTYYKFQGSVPDTLLTATRTTPTAGTGPYGGATVVQVWRGVDTTNPFDVTTLTATGASSSQPNPPAITPITQGSVIIAFGAGANIALSEATDATVIFAGMSNPITAHSNGSTADIRVYSASYNWVSGSYDPVAVTGGYTSGQNSWAATTLALRPSSGTPTPQTFNRSTLTASTSSVTVLRRVSKTASVIVSAQSSLNAVGKKVINRSSLISAVSTARFNRLLVTLISRQAVIAGQSSLTVAPQKLTSRNSAINSVSNLSATFQRVFRKTASFSSQSSVTVGSSQVSAVTSVVSISAIGALTVNRELITSRSANVAATAITSASSIVVSPILRSVSFYAAPTASVNRQLTTLGQVSITAQSNFVAINSIQEKFDQTFKVTLTGSINEQSVFGSLTNQSVVGSLPLQEITG